MNFRKVPFLAVRRSCIYSKNEINTFVHLISDLVSAQRSRMLELRETSELIQSNNSQRQVSLNIESTPGKVGAVFNF